MGDARCFVYGSQRGGEDADQLPGAGRARQPQRNHQHDRQQPNWMRGTLKILLSCRHFIRLCCNSWNGSSSTLKASVMIPAPSMAFTPEREFFPKGEHRATIPRIATKRSPACKPGLYHRDRTARRIEARMDATSPEYRLDPQGEDERCIIPGEWRISEEPPMMLHRRTRLLFSIYRDTAATARFSIYDLRARSSSTFATAAALPPPNSRPSRKARLLPSPVQPKDGASPKPGATAHRQFSQTLSLTAS
ncbi:MAG: hypothetical protein ACREFP_05595 [Acetobacteraceae bacterium]